MVITILYGSSVAFSILLSYHKEKGDISMPKDFEHSIWDDPFRRICPPCPPCRCDHDRRDNRRDDHRDNRDRRDRDDRRRIY